MNIVDLHCDTISKIYHLKKQNPAECLFKNKLQLDLCRMKTSGYLLQNFAIFVDLMENASACECAKEQISLFYEEMKLNADDIIPVTSYSQIKLCQQQQKMAALLTLEEGDICEGSLDTLREFYDLGVRMMTFTWNYENSLGSPGEPFDGATPLGGLTSLGVDFLQEMEHLGIIPDVSHLSDAGIADVAQIAKRPFVASHSNAFSLCSRGRNLSNTRIRQIADSGGVIGINYYGPFLTSIPNKNGEFFGTAADMAKHISHIAQIGGVACVALGSDFDGINELLELKDCSYLTLLKDALVKEGFHESEIDNIFGKNVLRVYQEWLK